MKSPAFQPPADAAHPETAARPHDAAVQHALVDAQTEFLTFLRRRLRDNGDAEEVFQKFALRVLERSGQLRDVRTVRGWPASCWRPP